jgi:RNA polymerase sigma-70 factor (ECF subfamily)
LYAAQKSFGMQAKDHAEPDEADAPGSTLGDVLFAKSTSPASESEWVGLVRAIPARDKRALHALYSRTHKIVFTLVMRISRNRQTAEELTLDVFHDVWRRAPSYDAAEGSVIGWVLNQARSRAIDRLRFEHRQKRVDRFERDGDTGGVAAGPHDIMENEQQARRLRSALGVLTADEREAIELAFFNGLTHVETAAKLGEPLGTVKTRIRSGLEKLRAALSEGGTP